MNSLRHIGAGIGPAVRALRIERKWTQGQLADRLGLSQSRLSQIERGGGSFSAEQFIEILRLFNVPVSHFVPDDRPARDAGLQNALVRLGASHLRESPDVLVDGALEDLSTVVREALLAGSPRLITALCPALVHNIDRIGLERLRASLAHLGLQRRLLWLLDNVRDALVAQLQGTQARSDKRQYQRALLILETFLKAHRPDPKGAAARVPDILDGDIRTEKTLRRVQKEASAISRRWAIATAIGPEDFQLALSEARAAA